MFSNRTFLKLWSWKKMKKKLEIEEVLNHNIPYLYLKNNYPLQYLLKKPIAKKKRFSVTRNILWQKTSKLWLLLNRKKLMENLGINVICAFLEILARLVLYYFHFSSNSLKLLLWYWWDKCLYSICAFCFSLVFTLLFMCIKIKIYNLKYLVLWVLHWVFLFFYIT